MSTTVAPAVAAVAVSTAAQIAAPAPAKSPASPVPPQTGTPQAHMEAARKVFSPDPSKAAPPAAAESTPAKPAEIAPAPDIIEAPKKPDAAMQSPAEVQHPEDKIQPPPLKDPNAKAGWEELKAVAREQRNRAMTLESQLNELKKAPATSGNVAELESLRTELTTTKAEAKAAMDRLLVLDVSNHPDFHKQFVQPKEAAIKAAKEVISYNEKLVPDLAALLAKPQKEFNAEVSAIIDKMNPADASMVMQSLRQARDLHAQEQNALSKAGEVNQQLQQRTQQTQRQAFESVVGDALPKFKKMDITEGMDAESKSAAEKYNQSIDGLRARAEAAAFGRIDEKGTANLALKAVALEHMVEHAVPAMQRAIKARDSLISDMQAELVALRGGRAPRVDGGDTPPAMAPAGETIEQAAKRLFAKA